MPKSVLWCWLQELICSCIDVVPSSSNNNEQEMHDNCPRYLPNPSAVLKTVAALIAKHSKQQQQPRTLNAVDTIDLYDMQKQQQELKRKQQQLSATDTKEQIVMQTSENIQIKSILKKRENYNISEESVSETYETGCEQIYDVCVKNTAKLLQCNNNNNNNNLQQQQHPRLINEKTLIVDSNTPAKTKFSEDMNQELPLCVNMNNDVVDGVQEYKLLQLYANRTDDEYKRPLVTKRIEFFEHSGTNTSNSSAEVSAIGVHNKSMLSVEVEKNLTPKSSIFSIYRVADMKTGKTTTNTQKIILNTYKKKLAEDETSFIKHDSNVLTALLSCMFIGTFLLLIFFPLSG